MQQLVITAVGIDRPGLVDQITGFLLDQGANIADSRMVNLRGQFAMLILVEASDAVVQSIRDKAVTAGAAAGLNLNVAEPSQAPGARAVGLPCRLRIQAMDQPGIVHKVTALLHRLSINIEELQTRLSPGSVSGTPLFSMEVVMTLPTNLALRSLRKQLEALCEELNCDMELSALA
jgi:glycine cleavage system transcriptional repressor